MKSGPLVVVFAIVSVVIATAAGPSIASPPPNVSAPHAVGSGVANVEKAEVTVGAPPELLRFIKSHGPDIVFYTSASNPIKNLSEIHVPGNRFSAWGPGEHTTMEDMTEVDRMLNGSSGTMKFISNDHFKTLFQEYPNLRLFFTFTGLMGVENITKSGGGVRVRFFPMRK